MDVGEIELPVRETQRKWKAETNMITISWYNRLLNTGMQVLSLATSPVSITKGKHTMKGFLVAKIPFLWT